MQMLGACSKHQQQFRVVSHAVVTVTEQQITQCLTEWRAARLAGQQQVMSARTDALLDQLHAGRLACALDTFDGDETGPVHFFN